MSTVWQTYQSMTRDRSVTGQKVARGTIRRILGYARPYRPLIVLFLGTLVVTSLLSVAQPLLFRRIVDDGISVGNASLVTWTALAIAGLAIADAAFGIVSRWYSARIGEGLIFDLRSQVYDHVQHQSIAFFTRAQTGALISRLNSDVIGAQQAFTSTLGGVLGNLISVSVVLVAMFALSWQITLASLILVPVFLLPARYMGRRLQALTREQMGLNAEMSSQMTERFNVSGALLVKLFGRPEDEASLFAGRARRVRDIGIRIAMANRWFFTALTLVAALATAVTYGLGGNLVIQGAITLGTLLALVALLAQLYGPLTALSNVRVDIMTALVSFERVFEVLDLDPLVREPAEPRALPSGALGVEFDSVSFTYPTAAEVSLASLESVAREESVDSSEPVLRDVSFTAAAGSLTALVGPSGAGKSTMTALVTRLYDPNDGAVRLGGVDVREIARTDLRSAIGVVSQDAHLFHDTIGANLRYADPNAAADDLMQACEDAQIINLIEQLPDGLDTVVGDRGYRLSGGEKQRLALARLFLKAPRVVVLDEATAHLDSENERLVQRALDSALDGRTSLVIAHRLSTIKRADQILVVDAGRIIQQGTHGELLAAGGMYETLYRTQFSDG
ncbi:MAG: ABC transporter ATP-binding protein/permease [Candidatus Nanopelagicales bacterium]|jgi:ATP-binding cassette, subfamily B, bacterial|nr:ABC transporter ATP-binding protein/permease [Candidatus Nanopelagicales bacterium]MCH1463655.1 ABC transporter ATP-binding protein/permease [Candidatus Nanopelagicales bacterium]MCH9707023.1 ABC transporter ATP-binding protein/permease [Actinomycetes bacterium]MCH9850673.1 ABC transporter ATP-binding protein/permease [Actinomycetes bacterium]NKB93054.1 ATP-binding cassette domain-containing protein [Candidatus Nanopelagicales bacterium]